MTKVPYSIRIDQALLEKIREKAKETNRSVNNFIENALMLSVLKDEKQISFDRFREEGTKP
jgi:hypothetical protein